MWIMRLWLALLLYFLSPEKSVFLQCFLAIWHDDSSSTTWACSIEPSSLAVCGCTLPSAPAWLVVYYLMMPTVVMGSILDGPTRGTVP